MLLARRPKTEQEDQLANQILKEYGIEDEFNIASIKYLLIVNDQIVGLSKVETFENMGVLKYIVISKKETGDNLGDALLRSIFNYCLNNNIYKIYFLNADKYLIKMGFTEKINILNIEGEEKEFLLELDLEEFFIAPCKSSKGMR